MKNIILIICLILFSHLSQAQKAADLFNGSETSVTWLGIDYSHVKLIGDFSQFSGAGEKSASQIKNIYFPAWNHLIINEQDKYDVKGMLKKEEVIYEIDLILDANAHASVENMETYNPPKYTKEDIKKFVAKYKPKGKGIGILFIAECLNSGAKEGYFHFVAINIASKEILVCERLRGEPSGFGIKNYWAGCVYDIMKNIRKTHYKAWKTKYSK